MIESNLIKQVFIEPIKGGADTLLILSGYATPNMVSLLIKKLQEEKYCIKDINLIVGMTAYNGISISNHRGFLELHNQYFESGTENFSCSYIYDGLPVHSNLYIWLKEDMPQIAFTGSASFIQPAFTGRRKEILSECNAEATYKIYEEAERNSIYCNLSEVEDNVIIYKDKWIDDIDEGAAVLNGAGIKSVKLSLLTKNGTIGKRSGLNWGQRPNRNKNEAYIGVPAKIARSGFFPSNEHFSVITDDNHFLILRTEQDYYKAITTPLSNSQLGEYFRNRLNLPNGAFVNTSDVVNYGRTNVEFFKIDDEQYYMDFSV